MTSKDRADGPGGDGKGIDPYVRFQRDIGSLGTNTEELPRSVGRQVQRHHKEVLEREHSDKKQEQRYKVLLKAVARQVQRYHKEVLKRAHSDKKQEQRYEVMFASVQALTDVCFGICPSKSGESRFDGGQPLISMVKNFARGGSENRALATYYWFHTSLTDKSYARQIDAEILEGKSYEERFGWTPFELDNDVNSQEAEAASESRGGIADEKPPLGPSLTGPRRTTGDYHFASRHLEVLGREDEQDVLREFRDAGPGFRWMQLAGAGGQGKSRLAYELIMETGVDWEKGFIKDADLAAFKDHWKLWTPEKPHLIVVDYVIGAEASLKPAMQALAERRDDFAVSVCLLLVERQAWNDGGLGVRAGSSGAGALEASFGRPTANWYDKLTAGKDGLVDKGLDDARFKDDGGRYEDSVVHLGPLEPNQLCSIVRQLDKEQSIAASDDEIEKYLREIDADGRPLYAYFLAQALLGGAFRPGWRKKDLLTWVLHHDRQKRWKSLFPGALPHIGDNPPKLEGESKENPAMRMALLATMIDGFHCADFPYEEGWSRPSGSSTSSTIRHQALMLADAAIPGTTPPMEIPGRQPDLLGDWFVLRSIDFGQPLD